MVTLRYWLVLPQPLGWWRGYEGVLVSFSFSPSSSFGGRFFDVAERGCGGGVLFLGISALCFFFERWFCVGRDVGEHFRGTG